MNIEKLEAGALPITLAEALFHLKEPADSGSNDAYIMTLVAAATSACEQRIERSLTGAKYRMTVDGFGCGLDLPFGPVSSIDLVEYRDVDGAQQTLSSYQIKYGPMTETLVPAPLESFPSTQAGRTDAVVVEYTTGWVVPAEVKQWILLTLTEMYETRGLAGEKPQDVHRFYDSLLAPYKHWRV